MSFDLTQREWDVAAGLLSGLTNKEIAEKIGCAMPTVRVHVSAILRKTGSANRTEAALKLDRMAS